MQRSYLAAATSATSSAEFQFIETAWTGHPSEAAASFVHPVACSALASCSTSFVRESVSVTRLATPGQSQGRGQRARVVARAGKGPRARPRAWARARVQVMIRR